MSSHLFFATAVVRTHTFHSYALHTHCRQRTRTPAHAHAPARPHARTHTGGDCYEESFFVEDGELDICPNCFKKARGAEKKAYAGAKRQLMGEVPDLAILADPAHRPVCLRAATGSLHQIEPTARALLRCIAALASSSDVRRQLRPDFHARSHRWCCAQLVPAPATAEKPAAKKAKTKK
jgi:hypothetical protein